MILTYGINATLRIMSPIKRNVLPYALDTLQDKYMHHPLSCVAPSMRKDTIEVHPNWFTIGSHDMAPSLSKTQN